jgi:hypothetical protein
VYEQKPTGVQVHEYTSLPFHTFTYLGVVEWGKSVPGSRKRTDEAEDVQVTDEVVYSHARGS